MVPVDAAGEVPAPLLDLLRVYDPDLVAGHVPVLADVADADATMIEKIVKGHAYAGEAPADTWQRMSTEWVRGEGWASLANQLDAWCSPFKDVDPDSGSFTAGAVHWLDRYQDSDRDITIMPSSSEEQILTLNLSEVDPLIALMVETRIGAIDTRLREQLNVVEIPVIDEDLPNLISLAILGGSRSYGWDVHARYLSALGETAHTVETLTIEEFLTRTPFARTKRWTSRVRTIQDPPIVCVVGDSAEDHALAVFCDRLFHHGSWVPRPLFNSDNTAGRTAKVALHQLRHLPGAPRRPVLVTSSSESFEDVKSIVADIASLLGPPDPSEREFEAIRVDALVQERGRCILADPEAFTMKRTVPLRVEEGESSLLAPIPLPLPEAAQHVGNELCWYVDVSMRSHLPPARTALSSSSLLQYSPGSFPEAVVRAGRRGLTFASTNMGYIFAGVHERAVSLTLSCVSRLRTRFSPHWPLPAAGLWLDLTRVDALPMP